MVKFFTADKDFVDACEAANCQPTKRQWKKWKEGKGIAKAVLKGHTEPLQRKQRFGE